MSVVGADQSRPVICSGDMYETARGSLPFVW